MTDQQFADLAIDSVLRHDAAREELERFIDTYVGRETELLACLKALRASIANRNRASAKVHYAEMMRLLALPTPRV